jgi:diguanylate cyclase (GGDEF)-like protein
MEDQPPQILVVDDELDMCWALVNTLRPAGYAVITTTSGAGAMEKARQGSFKLALLDIRLPDMEGTRLLAPLRQMHPDMAVIMVTGYASVDTALRAINEGASAYLTKPLDLDEVLTKVGEALERQRLVVESRRLYQAAQRELVQRRQAEEQLVYMATHDALTGLPSRALFNDRLTLELAHAHRNGQRLAVALLDLDHFKDVNDTLGHSVGDQLLKLVSHRFTSLLRRSDTVARIGGDEFMLILPGIARVEDADNIAQKILKAIRKPFVWEGHDVRVTASLGMALYPHHGEDAGTLMRHADIAMYTAKGQGRDNVQCYCLERGEMDKRANVLIVDDEPDMCWALENILRTAGFTATTTTKGTEALELLGGKDYAAAFVDAKLPDLNGLELAALIRQRSPHTAVVVISGYFYQEDKAINEGLEKDLFIGFVAKPFDLEEVRLMAQRAVEGAEGARKEDYASSSHSVGG